MSRMISVEISERTYQYIQQHAVAFEDTVDSALTRLLGLDKTSGALTVSPQPSSSANRGALEILVKPGLVHEGDDLQWHRAKKGITYSAKVTADGNIQLDSGQLVESPSGAAVAVAGGNHPGWDVWVHVPSGLTLAELRSQVAPHTAKPAHENIDWQSTLEKVLNRLPHGSWTSYGDLGRLVDRNPRELGSHLSSATVANAHRVLQHNGKISPSFHWVDEDRGDVHELLRSEGVLPSSSNVAAPEQRLHVEDLRRLLED